MKTIIEANTDTKTIGSLLAGNRFRSRANPDSGNRYYIEYDSVSEMYWLYQEGEIVPISWVHGIAKDGVYTQNMINESRNGGWLWFPLSDVFFYEDATEGLEYDPELDTYFDPKEPSDSPYDVNW